MALPFGSLTLGLVLVNGVIHYFMDQYKPKLVKLLKISDLAGFLADQFLHILLLYLISLTAVPHGTGLILPDPQVVRLLLVIILVTSFAAILNQYILGAAFPRADNSFFAKGEKYVGIVNRLVITFILYISVLTSPFFLMLLILAVLALLLVYRRIWSSWMSSGQLVFKLLLDLAVSMGGISLLFWV
jgi:hypothetical protein